MAYEDFKYLTRRAASNKILRDEAFNIAKNPKCDEYQRCLDSMVYNFFDKKSACLARLETLVTRDKSASGSGIKSENISNQELAEELQKPIMGKFQKRKA